MLSRPLLRLLLFLRNCVRWLCVHTGYSDSGGDFQHPRHTRVSLPVAVGRGLSKSPFVCGCVEQREGSLLLLLLLCWWVALTNSRHPPISNNLYAEVAQEA